MRGEDDSGKLKRYIAQSYFVDNFSMACEQIVRVRWTSKSTPTNAIITNSSASTTMKRNVANKQEVEGVCGKKSL